MDYQKNKKTYLGAIILFYKKTADELLFLVIKNAKTGNITFIGGAKEEDDRSLEQCAQREIEEELGLKPNEYELNPTGAKHEFVFGPNKPERAGHKGSYVIFSADASALGEIRSTDELMEVRWLSEKEASESLSFTDLKKAFQDAVKSIGP